MMLQTNKGRLVLLLMWVLGSSSNIYAQTYLYLEDMTQVKAIKIPEGAKVSIKTVDGPEWTSYRVERLLPDENLILHTTGMLHLAEVTHIRLERKWVTALGNSLQAFGAAWGVYGLIVLAAQAGTTTSSIVAIGSLVPLATGYIMKKIWRFKSYRIGPKNRLKILDLSFPDDPYNEKEKRIKYQP